MSLLQFKASCIFIRVYSTNIEKRATS
jgi:hypothetical protein